MAAESESGALPDFVVIGALKCGTSYLYDLLTQHPHVERASSKELHYFNKNFDKGTEWYRSQFLPQRLKDGRRTITGEASAGYISSPSAPVRMAKVLPQARLIVLLRNPIDRAYSHYHHRVRKQRGETRSFEQAIEAELEWLLREEHASSARVVRPRLKYLSRGIYVDQLVCWLTFFNEDQILILKSEDFFEHTQDTLKVVLDFLDLPEWEPEEASKIPNQGHYEDIDPVIRQRLEDFFEPHNRRLYKYLGVDFGW